MIDLVRRLLVRFLRVDTTQPEAPLGEEPESFRASQRHLTYLLVIWALKNALLVVSFGVPIAGACVALVVEGHAPWLAAVVGAFGVAFLVTFALFGYASIRLDWEMRWYILTDRALRIREGIVAMREVTLTLANVQEIKLSQGPIQRVLGLTDIVVDTAGGGASAASAGSVHGHHGILRGVDGGSDLRRKIEARVKQRRGAGLGDPDDHHVHDDAPTAPSTPQSPSASAGDLLEILTAVRDEARALRESVAQRPR